MKAKMVETGALIGGELSGHIFIKDRWYGFDDGMYAGTRLLEIMTLRDQTLDEIFSSFPVLPATPEIKIAIDESAKFSLIESLIQTGQFENGNLTTLDGLRVDFAKGWGLVRASNTSPALTLRFEGESEDIINDLQRLFKRELLKLNPNLAIPF
jgi:phosphomannomutase/phosphoglucomutase